MATPTYPASAMELFNHLKKNDWNFSKEEIASKTIMVGDTEKKINNSAKKQILEMSAGSPHSGKLALAFEKISLSSGRVSKSGAEYASDLRQNGLSNANNGILSFSAGKLWDIASQREKKKQGEGTIKVYDIVEFNLDFDEKKKVLTISLKTPK